MSQVEDEYDHLVKQEDLPKGVILRDHVVDGIQEYDQSLPRWWLMILFGVMAFAVVYWMFLDDRRFVGSYDPALEKELSVLDAKRLANSIDATNDALFWEMAANENFVDAGRKAYSVSCVACHGANLTGGIGFNLVDAEWVHGALPSQIYTTIHDGVPEKGMQAWGSILGQKRIAEIVAYILTENPELRP